MCCQLLNLILYRLKTDDSPIDNELQKEDNNHKKIATFLNFYFYIKVAGKISFPSYLRKVQRLDAIS